MSRTEGVATDLRLVLTQATSGGLASTLYTSPSEQHQQEHVQGDRVMW